MLTTSIAAPEESARVKEIWQLFMTSLDNTKIYLDRRKEKFSEIFVTEFLYNQNILFSVSSEAFSCW